MRRIIEAIRARPRTAAAMLAVAVATAIAYLPAMRGPFIFDDEDAIMLNPTIQRLWPPSVPLNPPHTTSVTGRPIANLSLAINYAMNRAAGVDQRVDPFGPNKTIVYRATNVFLHLMCGALLFGILHRTFASRKIRSWWVAGGVAPDAAAGVIAALWTLHPLQSEAVNYVVQRTELLGGMFYLGTLYAAIRAGDTADPGERRRWYGASIASCFLGMGSKEMMATAPVMVVLYDRAFRYDSWRALRERRWFYLGLAATLVWLVRILSTTPRGTTVGFDLGISAARYLYTQAWAITEYVRLTLWPDRLSIDYGTRPLYGWAGIPGLIWLTAFLLVAIAAWRRVSRWGWVAFAGAWFFLILGPSSSVVPIVTEVAAERRFYLPVAAVLTLLVVGAEALRRRIAAADDPTRTRWIRNAAIAGGALFAVISWWKARDLAGDPLLAIALQMVFGAAGAAFVAAVVRGVQRRWLVGALAAALAATTMVRSRAYASDEAIWRDAVRKRPDVGRAWGNLGISLANQGRLADAESHFRRSIEADSGYVVGYYSLGAAAQEAGRTAEARALFEQALARNPGYIPARASLGDMLLAEGDAAAAIPHLERAAAQPPSDETLVDLATAYLATGQSERATTWFRRVLEKSPARPDVKRLLGSALLQQGKVQDAAAVLQEAVMAEPRSGAGFGLLSLAYARLGHPNEAAAAADRAARGADGDAHAFLFAGQAMLVVGRARDAERYLVEAARLDSTDVAIRQALTEARAAARGGAGR
jgi:tetratricopeptide (TPR) repeat protein